MTIEALKQRAAVLEQQGEVAQAIAAYREVVTQLEGTAAASKELPLYVKLGDLYIQTQDVTNGLEMYERAGRHYAALGSSKGVIAACLRIVRASPRRTPAYLEFVRLMIESGHVVEGRLVLLDYAQRMKWAKALDILKGLEGKSAEAMKPVMERALDAADRAEEARAKAAPAEPVVAKPVPPEAPQAAPPPPVETRRPEPPPARAPEPPKPAAPPAPAAPEPLEIERSYAESVSLPVAESPREPTPGTLQTSGGLEFLYGGAESLDAPRPPVKELQSPPEPPRAPPPPPVAAPQAAPPPMAPVAESRPIPPAPAPFVSAAPPAAVEPPRRLSIQEQWPTDEPIREASSASAIAPLPPEAEAAHEEPAGADESEDLVAALVAQQRARVQEDNRSSGAGVRLEKQFRRGGSRMLWVAAAVVVVAAGAGLVVTGVIPLGSSDNAADGAAAGPETGASTAAAVSDTGAGTASGTAANDSNAITRGGDTSDSGAGIDSAATAVRPPTTVAPPVVDASEQTLTTPRLPGGVVISRPIVVIAGLPIESVNEISAEQGSGYSVVQILRSGDRLTITSVPPADEDLGQSDRIQALPGDSALGVVRFRGMVVSAQGMITTTRLQDLLGRLVEIPPNN